MTCQDFRTQIRLQHWLPLKKCTENDGRMAKHGAKYKTIRVWSREVNTYLFTDRWGKIKSDVRSTLYIFDHMSNTILNWIKLASSSSLSGDPVSALLMQSEKCLRPIIRCLNCSDLNLCGVNLSWNKVIQNSFKPLLSKFFPRQLMEKFSRRKSEKVWYYNKPTHLFLSETFDEN